MAGSRQGAAGFGGRGYCREGCHGNGPSDLKKRHFFFQGTGATHCSAPHTQDLGKVFPDAAFF